MIKAVIFDLDGVLTKSDHYHTCAWREVCRSGLSHLTSAVVISFGESAVWRCAQLIVRQGGKQLSDEALKRFAEEKKSILYAIPPGYDAQRCSPRRDRAALLFAAPPLCNGCSLFQQKCIADIRKNRTRILFFGRDRRKPDQPLKPDPEVFQKAAQALMVPYEKCLVLWVIWRCGQRDRGCLGTRRTSSLCWVSNPCRRCYLCIIRDG